MERYDRLDISLLMTSLTHRNQNREILTMTLNTSKPIIPWLMLVSRSVFFVLFQLLIAGLLALTGNQSGRSEAVYWWLFVAILTNIVSISLLVIVHALVDFATLATYFIV